MGIFDKFLKKTNKVPGKQQDNPPLNKSMTHYEISHKPDQKEGTIPEERLCTKCGAKIDFSIYVKNNGLCIPCITSVNAYDQTKFPKSNQPKEELRVSLCNAVDAGDLAEVKKLLVQGADTNCETGPKRASPLLLASHKGWTEIVRLLIKSGARVNKQNTDGLTALMVASMNGHIPTLIVLHDNNAELNLQNTRDKFTALMCTVQAKQVDAFMTLLEMGADVNIRNTYGETVLEMAQKNNFNEIIYLLASSREGHIDDAKKDKIHKMNEIRIHLYDQDSIFEQAFEVLFGYLRDVDPEIKEIAASYLNESPYADRKLIEIYKTNMATDINKAVLAGRVLGRKLSKGKSETISEDTTEMFFNIRVAFTPYSCPHCGKINIGIPVPTKYLSFYSLKVRDEDKNSLPVLCDYCNSEFYLGWD